MVFDAGAGLCRDADVVFELETVGRHLGTDCVKAEAEENEMVALGWGFLMKVFVWIGTGHQIR